MYSEYFNFEAVEYLERRGYYVFRSEEEIIDYVLRNKELLQKLLLRYR